MEIASWNYPYGTDEKPARQRRNSKRLPPEMSELRIWLLGDNGPDICSVGNWLLERNAFNAAELDSFQRFQEACIMTQRISVTIIPNLFDKKMTEAHISQELNNCVQMSAPGPHVLLLVLQEGSAGKKRLKKLATILNSWSPNAQKHTIVLLLSPVCGTGKESKAVEKKLKESWTYHRLKYIKEQCRAEQSSVTELFREIKTMTERNKGAYLILDIKESSPTDIPSTSQQPHSAKEKKENTEMSGTLMGLTKYLPFWNQPSQITAEASTPAQNLNLVLLGRNSAEKSHIANTILGQTESADMSEIVGIYKCLKEEGLVCGRPVTVVNMPEFYNTSLCQMDVLSETYKALSLFSSNIHVFLLVLPVRSLNDDDKGELTMIRSIFGTGDVMFWAHLMILFICEEDRKIDAVFDFIQNNGDVQKLYQKCGNKYHIVSINKSHDSDHMAELLQKIDAMTAGNRYVCYSSDMYVEAQLKMRVQQETRNKQLEQEISELMEYKQTAEKDCLKTVGSTNCLRIVLIGKTGNGKSATGNTILNKNVFKSEPSSISVTSSCQKEEGVVNGMPVAIVDTPGLFDTQASNDEVKEEILNCISLLSPGPHVFLLILTIGRFTKEERETLDLIKETFGKNAGMFSIIIFTHGDKLQNRPIECYLENCDPHLKKLVRDCGERCHMIDNTKQDTAKQVIDLLEKVNRMIEKNGGGCYTNEMFQEAEAAIKQEMDRILQQKKEEIEKEKKQLCDTHKREMAEMTRRIEEQKVLMERERKVREEELRVKEEFLKNEIKKREEQEAKERKDREAAKELRRSEEERQQQEWERNLKEIEDKKAELERKLQKKKQEETERYEREKREMEERHKERLKIEKEQEEYREKLNKERSEWEQKQKKMIEEFEQEKKQREAAEKQRIEDEGREKEKLEREFKKSKDDMRKEREEWEKSRKEEWDKRVKEEEKRREEDREKLKKLKDAFEREHEEEANKRKREDRIRREQEERERKQMEEEYERKLKDMKMKYEEEARKQAEEFNEFRKKYKTEFHELMLKHDQQMEELKRQYDEKSKMYEKEYSNLTDLSKEKRRELNEKMRQIEEKHQREVDELKKKYESKCVVL